jgi:hypothetical protein
MGAIGTVENQVVWFIVGAFFMFGTLIEKVDTTETFSLNLQA